MATYNVNGQKYHMPDEMSDDEAMKIIQSDGSTSPNGGEGANPSSSQAAPDAANYSPAPASVDPASLASSPDWVRASAVRFKSAHPGEPLPSPADLAEFGLDQMGWFNYNTPAMAVDANQLRSASAEDKKAFLYLMDTYDKLELSWGGAGRFIKGAALDPLNYVGLGTLGLGVAAGTATRIGSKEALKAMMRAGIQYGIEGALQSGVQDSIHQNAEINAGGKEEFSYGELAGAAGVGAVAGGVLGGAAEGAGTLLRGARKGVGKAAEAVPTPEASPTAASGQTPAGGAPSPVPTSVDLPSSGPLPGVSGTFTVQHGMGSDEFKSLGDKPYKFESEYHGNRYDDNVFGDKVVYLDNTGDWVGGKNGMDFAGSIEVEFTPKNGLLVTPDTIGYLKKEHGLTNRSVTPDDLLAIAKKEKRDSIIIQGFDHDKDVADQIRGNYGKVFPDKYDATNNFIKITEDMLSPDDKAIFERQVRREYDALRVKNNLTFEDYKRTYEGNGLGSTLADAHYHDKYGADFFAVQNQAVALDPSIANPTGNKSSLVDGSLKYDGVKAELPKPAAGPNPILAAIKDVTDNNGMRYNPTGEARTAQAADPISEILKLTPETAKPLIEEVRQAVLTGNEGDTLLASISQATEKLLRQRNDEFVIARDAVTPEAKAQATAQLEKLDQILDIVRKLDLDTSSTQGSAFAGRNNLMNTGAFREVSPESIMAAKGIDPATATPMQIADARNEFGEKLFQRIEVASKAPEVYKKLVEVEAALANNDITGAVAGHAELTALKEHLADVMSKDPTLGQQIAGGFNKVMAGVNEYVISTVFTTKTTIINMLPSLMKLIYRPALDAIVRGPLDSVSWRMAGAQYATMALHIDTAFKAGVAAFRYEKGILSTDFSKYLEHDPVFAKWYGGGVLRILPRILNATDEMFSQLAYRGFVASESTGFALKQGTKLGYTGQALEDFVKDTVSKNMANGFDGNVGVGALDMLRKEGISRGMSGDKLTEWMKLELDKNQDLLRTATNQSGVNYANDLLFKREFSGEGGVSMLAKEYERFVNKVPLMRLVGQLFFRTPVRVFEEGFRLTPGLNMISGVFAGQFLKDLAGKNGVPAQVRAQGEAMVSLALGAMVMNMYAQGKITGGGPDNWKVGRTLEDGKKFSPYTIKIGDHELNFRNLDPFSTPLKIMANVLDRISVLRYREAQGDYQNKTAYAHAAATISVAWLSVVKAVQDANLTDGISQLSQFMADTADPEHKEIALTKWLGQKAALLVPNQLNKLVTLGEDNPAMNDPVTAEQYVRGRFNPNDPLVPKRYNALGRVVEVENPWAGITGIDLQTSKKSYSKDELVLQELGKIAINGDKSFNAPYAVSYVPAWQGHDLRLMPSSDGKTSMYDKWQQYIAKTGMTDALYNALVENKAGSMGTKITPGSREIIATQITNGFRKQAFMQMLMDETNGLDTLKNSKIEQGKAKSGQRDAPSMPWQ